MMFSFYRKVRNFVPQYDVDYKTAKPVFHPIK